MLTGKIIDRLHQYALLMRLNRPIGILLLLWPTLWALWIAGDGGPTPLVLAVFVLGVILMRSAGCVINDYADRNIDAHVTRTANRPLVTGRPFLPADVQRDAQRVDGPGLRVVDLPILEIGNTRLRDLRLRGKFLLRQPICEP